jgi:hypothetical protein
VLAQDGHSLGEESIYQVLWRSGKPENSDANGARIVSLGAAEIGYRANMAKKNVRQNIARLYEKLAIEILEDFNTVSSKPRTYRVYSYKQILERRRAAGLEYVLRNKGVVFCTAEGVEIKTDPGNLTAPGDETSIRPAPSKRSRKRAEFLAQAEMLPLEPAQQGSDCSQGDEERRVAEILNRHWRVDEAAAEQLLESCRAVRPDARIEEIEYFVEEKARLIRGNHRIDNPTGLILATVPKSFMGRSFEDFRRLNESRAQLAVEEQKRRQDETAGMRAWLEEQIRGCEAIVHDPRRSQEERDVAEHRLRGFATWNL